MSRKPEFSSEVKKGVSPSYIANIRDVYYGIEYLPSVEYKNACRYKNLRTIQDDITKNIHHESWNQVGIVKSREDTYYTVTNADENRLDIIANRFYGTPRFWWIIALANYIMDPFYIPVGTTLRIPPKQSLYLSGGVLSG